MAHLQTVTDFYRRRRDLMVAAADKHLKDLCHWDVPQGGMFLWIKVRFSICTQFGYGMTAQSTI
jgi:kynurenine/2-aminoadipate aminotransferase